MEIGLWYLPTFPGELMDMQINPIPSTHDWGYPSVDLPCYHKTQKAL